MSTPDYERFIDGEVPLPQSQRLIFALIADLYEMASKGQLMSVTAFAETVDDGVVMMSVDPENLMEMTGSLLSGMLTMLGIGPEPDMEEITADDDDEDEDEEGEEEQEV
jgi:hypothetical protein